MNVLKPHLQNTTRTLLDAGATQREVERVTGVSRHTIRAWQMRLSEEAGASCPGAATSSVEQTAPPAAAGSGAVHGVAVRAAQRHHRSPAAPATQRHGDLRGPGRPLRLRRPSQLSQAFRRTAQVARA